MSITPTIAGGETIFMRPLVKPIGSFRSRCDTQQTPKLKQAVVRKLLCFQLCPACTLYGIHVQYVLCLYRVLKTLFKVLYHVSGASHQKLASTARMLILALALAIFRVAICFRQPFGKHPKEELARNVQIQKAFDRDDVQVWL